MGEGEMDVAERTKTSYQGKDTGEGMGSRARVRPALAEERSRTLGEA